MCVFAVFLRNYFKPGNGIEGSGFRQEDAREFASTVVSKICSAGYPHIAPAILASALK